MSHARARAPWVGARAAGVRRRSEKSPDANPFALLSMSSGAVPPMTSLKRRRRKGRKRPRPGPGAQEHRPAGGVADDDAGDENGTRNANDNDEDDRDDAEHDDGDDHDHDEEEEEAEDEEIMVTADDEEGGKLHCIVKDERAEEEVFADGSVAKAIGTEDESVSAAAVLLQKGKITKSESTSDRDAADELEKSWGWTAGSVVATEDSIVVLLRPGQRAPFVGAGTLRVLRGAVEVLGYPAQPGSCFDMHCPRWLALPAPTALPPDKWGENEQSWNNNPGLPDRAWERLARMVKKERDASVVMFSSVGRSENRSLASSAADGDRYHQLAQKERLAAHHYFVRGFSTVVNPAKLSAVKPLELHVPLFAPSEALRGFARDVLADFQGCRPCPVALVAGAKGSGKSTSVRYLCNVLLGNGATEVMYVDLDPGQPEFTPPGMLSYRVVSEPLRNPPHINVFRGASTAWEPGSVDKRTEQAERRGIRRTIFFGAASPKADPLAYTTCADALARKLQMENGQRTVVVINCFGWIKGLGVDLLQAVVELFQPSHVLKIMGTSTARRFDILPRPGLKIYASSWPLSNSPSAQDTVTGASPAEVRRLRLTAFFCGGLPTLPEKEQAFLRHHESGRSALRRVFGRSIPCLRTHFAEQPASFPEPGVLNGSVVDPAGYVSALLTTAETIDIPIESILFGLAVGWASGCSPGNGEGNISGFGYDIPVHEVSAAIEESVVAIAFPSPISKEADCAEGSAQTSDCDESPKVFRGFNRRDLRYTSLQSMDGKAYHLIGDHTNIAALSVAGLAFVKTFDIAEGVLRIVSGNVLRKVLSDTVVNRASSKASRETCPRVAVLRGQIDLSKEMLQSSAHSSTRHVSWEAMGGPVGGIMRSRNNIVREDTMREL